jgi:hypothetical protein
MVGFVQNNQAKATATLDMHATVVETENRCAGKQKPPPNQKHRPDSI